MRITENKPANLPKPSYFIGLDLGQAQDYSALVILERHGSNKDDYTFHCRHLHRWQLRTPYPQIVSDTAETVNNPALSGFTVLAVDATGCGAPVVDLFKKEKMRARLVPIQITVGSEVTESGDAKRIPKRDLVGVVSVALQSGKLKIAESLQLAETLTRELQNFKVKITDAGNDTYGAGSEWRVGSNDDLVLSLAMALWCATGGIKPRVIYKQPNYYSQKCF